ncbi:MAG: DNA repair protein RecO [Gammaproteobacteria bacterium]|nr:MAG: DNA repair protein RecO [Gammaproteobacteria bacterium]
MKRVSLEPAYVLHRRPYRESSFLVEIFTQAYGRFTLVAKGVRKAGSSMQGLLQPFIPLLVSWSGKGELMTLIEVEVNGEAKRLQGDCLFAGFYLNELLMYLLQKWDAHANLYRLYENTLTALQAPALEQRVLRLFEKRLLEELGYGLLLKADDSLQQAIVAEQYYRFVPEQGFVLAEGSGISPTGTIFSGRSLLAIAQEDWADEESLQDAKRLTRLLLTPLLGSRPIHSRRLFVKE